MSSDSAEAIAVFINQRWLILDKVSSIYNLLYISLNLFVFLPFSVAVIVIDILQNRSDSLLFCLLSVETNSVNSRLG